MKKAAITPTLEKWEREQESSWGLALNWRADRVSGNFNIRMDSKCKPNLSNQGLVETSNPFP